MFSTALPASVENGLKKFQENYGNNKGPVQLDRTLSEVHWKRNNKMGKDLFNAQRIEKCTRSNAFRNIQKIPSLAVENSRRLGFCFYWKVRSLFHQRVKWLHIGNHLSFLMSFTPFCKNSFHHPVVLPFFSCIKAAIKYRRHTANTISIPPTKDNPTEKTTFWTNMGSSSHWRVGRTMNKMAKYRTFPAKYAESRILP